MTNYDAFLVRSRRTSQAPVLFGFLEHTREYGERGLGGDIFMPLPRFSTSIDSIHHDVFGAGFISLPIKKN